MGAERSELISPKLLELIVCPATHQPLTLLSQEQRDEINRNISAGKISTVAGEAVSEELEAGLMREDAKVCYPIRGGIPVLIAELGLRL